MNRHSAPAEGAKVVCAFAEGWVSRGADGCIAAGRWMYWGAVVWVGVVWVGVV